MKHDIHSVFAVHDFFLAVDKLKDGLDKGHVNECDVSSASRQAENFKEAYTRRQKSI